MNNRIKFKEYITLLEELYNKEISNALKDLYWAVLKPYSDEKCEKAFKQIIATSKFFPKPVEFLEILSGTEKDRASVAWMKVSKAISWHGGDSVEFDDPVIHSVVEAMGGWSNFGSWSLAEDAWKKKEFEDYYRILSKRDFHPNFLQGRYDHDNRVSGHLKFVKQPILIGQGEDGEIKRLERPEPKRLVEGEHE